MERPTVGTPITDAKYRAWAREHGIPVGARGRVSDHVVQAFWAWARTQPEAVQP